LAVIESLSAPVLLDLQHDVSGFSSGESSLDAWLRQRANRNQLSGASRTFVVCDGQKIVAYYALASSAITVTLATGRFRRNMPDPIPVVVLARLAVDRSYQRQGLGRVMVQDAFNRILSAADIIGIHGVIVHALSESAKRFYERVGFDASPLDPNILMVALADLRQCVSPDFSQHIP
jgi:Predicted acetyltransferase